MRRGSGFPRHGMRVYHVHRRPLYRPMHRPFFRPMFGWFWGGLLLWLFGLPMVLRLILL